MTAITLVAAIFCVSVVILPGFAELVRISNDRSNPIRLLRVQTRRNQAASASFVGRC